MLTLYLRNEPTTDEVTLRQAPPEALLMPSHQDVVVYRDEDATNEVGRYEWHDMYKPDRSYKRINHNCHSYKVVWLPDKHPQLP